MPGVLLIVADGRAHGSEMDGAIGHHKTQAIGFVDVGGANGTFLCKHFGTRRVKMESLERGYSIDKRGRGVSNVRG